MPDDDQPGVTTPSAPATPAAAPAPAPVVPGRVIGRGGEEIPAEAVSEIKARERRKFLKEHFGTEDEDEAARIKKRWEENAKKGEDAEKEREAKRLADLSESDRLKEELRIEREQRAQEKADLESKLKTREEQLEVERQDVLIGSIAGRYVAPKFLKFAKVEFSEYVDSLTKTELKALNQTAIDKWFAKFVKENPEYKPEGPRLVSEPDPKKPAAAPVVAPKRVPVGAPKPAPRAPAAGAQPVTGPGTFKGKKVSQLSKKEMDEYYKATTGRRKPY